MDEAKLLDLFEKIFEKISTGRSRGPTIDPTRELKEVISQLGEFANGIKKTTKETTVFRSFIEGQKRQATTYGEIQDTLDQFNEALKKATDEADNEAINAARNAYLDALSNERKKVAMNNFVVGVKNVTTNFVSGVGSATQEFITNIQQGSSGITIATNAISSVIDFIGKTSSGVGKSMTEVGLAMIAIPGIARIAGAALAGLGIVAQGIGGMSDTVKFGVKVLGEELTKATETFFKVTSAGAMFADGVTGFRNAAFEAGISTKKLADAVKASSESIYTSGMDIGTGVTKIGQVFKAGGDQFKLRLLNLGYDFQEQAELIADTMKYLSIAGRENIKGMASDEIRDETEKYAKSLKLISAITGDDAKKRLDQARQATANAAVQSELAKMDTATREQFLKDLALVPKELQTAVLQQRLLGTVVDKNAAIMMGITPQLGDTVASMSANLGKGEAVMGKLREGFAQDLKSMTESGQFSAPALAAIAGVQGAATDFSNFMSTLFLDMQQGAKEKGSVDELMKKFDQMKNTADPLTGTLNNIHLQGEKLATTLEKRLNDALPAFAGYLETTNNMLIKLINETGDFLKNLSSEKQARSAVENAQSEVATRRLKEAETELGSSIARGASPQEIRKARRAVDEATLEERFPFTPIDPNVGSAIGPGRAKGGISRGPTTGYLEKLHGAEAVVPLPDGRTIPVSLTLPKDLLTTNYVSPTVNNSRTYFSNNLATEKLAAEFSKIKTSVEDFKDTVSEYTIPLEFKNSIEMSNNSLKEVMREQNDLMRHYNSKFDDLIAIVSDTRTINQKLLNNTY